MQLRQYRATAREAALCEKLSVLLRLRFSFPQLSGYSERTARLQHGGCGRLGCHGRGRDLEDCQMTVGTSDCGRRQRH